MNYVSITLPVWPGDHVTRRSNGAERLVLDTSKVARTGTIEILTLEDGWRPLFDYYNLDDNDLSWKG